MRELKFRYWNPFMRDGGAMVNNPEMPHKEGWTIEQLFSERGWIWMQFTGLKDKNGNEIYEGDIVEGYNHCGDRQMGPSAIKYGRSAFCYDYGYCGLKPISEIDGIDWVVIGNIHENPELLEK